MQRLKPRPTRTGLAGRLMVLCGLLVAATVPPATVHAAPEAELWPRWQEHDPAANRQIDHGPWARFLEKYLVVTADDAANRVRYAAVSAADKKALDDYLAGLEKVPVTALSRPEQKAFWLNLYNALTVRTILDHYPVESIRDIKSGWFSPGPWDLKLTAVAGADLSLNDIEHRILRPIWQDNRIHYGVNCASIGCPSLPPEPFTADNTERLLDRGARLYVNSPRGARFDDGALILSRIYDWYQADFGGSEAGVLRHLRRWAKPPLAARLENFSGPIRYHYDWALNAPR